MAVRRPFALGLFCGAALSIGWVETHRWSFPARDAWAAATPPAGDVNGDGRLDLTDAIHILGYLFQGGPAPTACPDPPVPGPWKTLVMVRHAEKVGDALSPAGQEQAEKLRDIFSDVRVDSLVASTLNRTQLTLKPLAERDPANLLPMALFGTEAVDDASLDALVAHVEALPPGTLNVLCHHSTTLKPILERLGVSPELVAPLEVGGTSYDNLIILFLREGEAPIFFPTRGLTSIEYPLLRLGPPR